VIGNIYFVTGTSTGVGKTEVCVGLLEAATESGMSTLAIKPIASGSEMTPQGLRNDDAVALRHAMSMPLSYQQVNPYAFKPAIAPHIAAQQAGVTLDVDRLARHCRELGEYHPDLTIIEGAGGWRVPLNDQELYSDLPRRLGIPVILVVNMQLGCINHALLSCEAIHNDGLRLAGWVANCTTQEMSFYQDNLLILKSKISAPLLGEVPFRSSYDATTETKHIYKNIVLELQNQNSGLDL
jgi:dethiobiotin synthetase